MTLFFQILSLILFLCLIALLCLLAVRHRQRRHSGSPPHEAVLRPGYIFDNSVEAILIADNSFQVITANRAAQELLESDQLTDKYFPELFLPESRQRLMEQLAGNEQTVFLRAVTLCNNKTVSCSFSRCVSQPDNQTVFIFYLHEVTELKFAIEKLDQLANYDILTGLCNRHCFNSFLEQWIQRYKETQADFALFFLDLTNFKYINDTFGHSAGDKALKAVANALRSAILPEDVLGRFSGDEFVVLHPADSWEPMADQIRQALNNIDCSSFAPGFRIDAGIGHSLFSEAGNETSLFQIADLRMYNNKSISREASGVAALRRSYSDDSSSNVLDNDLFNAFSGASDHVYIYICDMRTDMSRWSRNAVEYFGMPSEYMVNAGEVWIKHVHPDDQALYQSTMEGIMTGTSRYHKAEYRAKNAQGEYVWLEARGQSIMDAGGHPKVFAGMMTRLDAQNKYDPLTRLKTVSEFSTQDFAGKSGSILMLGLDNFRSVVNTYGFGFGDVLLRQFARRMVDNISSDHIIYRMDGDEFMISSPGADREQTTALFHQLRKLAMDLGDEERTLTMGFTAGCVIYPDDGTTRETLMRNLEHSLEFAKRTDRGTLAFFSNEIAVFHSRQMAQRNLIKQAIQNNYSNFTIYYQPLVSSDELTIIGCEALLRWEDPNGSSIRTDELIQHLESDRGINMVGRWVADTVMAQAKRWHDQYGPIMVGFNVSYLQFRVSTFVSTLIQLAQSHQVDPRYIVIELTESCAVERIAELADSFRKLREFGFRIALDDFGIGYSTLLTLRNLPVDSVKVDHAFVRNLTPSNTTDQAIVRSVTNLAQELDVRVTLEGVENETVLNLVRPFYANYYQGFHFSKPMPAPEFEKLLMQGHL